MGGISGAEGAKGSNTSNAFTMNLDTKTRGREDEREEGRMLLLCRVRNPLFSRK